MRNKIVGMGLEPERLYNAVKRFRTARQRGENTWRVPTYQILKLHAAWSSTPPPLPLAGEPDGVGVRPLPAAAAQADTRRWFKELTHEPAA